MIIRFWTLKYFSELFSDEPAMLDQVNTLSRVRIAIANLEKVVPTLEDASSILRVLACSATGQEMSSYRTFPTSPRRSDNLDGPQEYHVILLDNCRSG